MKKIFTAILLSLLSVSVFAGKSDSTKYKNEVGLVLTDLIDGSYQFSYERATGKHITLKIGTAIKGKEGLVNLSGIDRDRLKTSDLTYSGVKIAPEFRYYLNKTQRNQLDGFYFGAYLKYSGFKSNIYGTYINKSEDEFTLDIDAKLHITTLGLMVGYKLPLSKRFNLDFLIAGPGQSWHNYSLHSNTTIPDEFFDDLSEALKNYSIFDLLHSDLYFSSKSRQAKFGMPTFRYALTLGFKF